MNPDSHENGGPVIEYLLKEVSFSTCDNKFFGELEKEMLVPNNFNVYGRIKNATSLNDYKLRLEFFDETTIAYLKRPTSSTVEQGRRILTYRLEDLINYDDYWWVPLKTETSFSLFLNLLPPFPRLNPVDLQISCRPDIAVGLNADVTTAIKVKAEEDIDQLLVTASTPDFLRPGTSIAITEFSGDQIKDPRQTVAAPNREFPLPELSLKKGDMREYKVKTRITADLATMTTLKCQQDLLRTKLVFLSDTTPPEPPCNVSVLDNIGRQIPVRRTERSTLMQATAQVMYSPFSIRREAVPRPQGPVIPVPAQ